MSPDELADYTERRVCTVGGVDIVEPVAEALRRLGRLERVLEQPLVALALTQTGNSDEWL